MSDRVEKKRSLIGISGKFGSGKDTVAGIIKKLDPDVVVLPFAGPLKRLVAFLGQIDVEILYTDEGKKQKNVRRQALMTCNMILDGVCLCAMMVHEYGFDDKRVMEIFKECIDFMDGTKSWGETLQHVGTAIFRDKIDKKFWVKMWNVEYQKYKEQGVIVTDVRFDEEARLLKELGFDLWRIESELEQRRSRIKTERDEKHSSETSLDDYQGFDVVIQNNSTLGDLVSRVVKAYTR